MEYQIHFDKKFYKDHKTGYWISTQVPKIRAHRWVWNNIHGKIPVGYHVHHKDENKSNNSIENLELIEGHRHLSIHSSRPENIERMRKIADENRHLTKAWHGSEEGLAWHKAHGILGWINREPINIICKVCGKESKTKTFHQEFCSNACKSAFRRKEGIDDEKRTCCICKKEFIANKYSKGKTCSRICRGALKKCNAQNS